MPQRQGPLPEGRDGTHAHDDPGSQVCVMLLVSLLSPGSTHVALPLMTAAHLQKPPKVV